MLAPRHAPFNPSCDQIAEPRVGFLVGAAGFEPTTCSTQNCRATRLRYTPIIWEMSSIHA